MSSEFDKVSCDEEDLESSSESEGFLSEDITKLKPYDFEPLASDTASDSDSSDHANYSITSPRVGNVEWCQCGNCKAMDTEVEILCCAEASEIPEEFFEG